MGIAGVGESLLGAHEHARAREAFESALRLEEEVASRGDSELSKVLRVKIGTALLLEGRHREAVAALTDAVAMNPVGTDGLFQLAVAQNRLSDVRGAASTLRTLLDRFRGPAASCSELQMRQEALVALANEELVLGHHGVALARLQEAERVRVVVRNCERVPVSKLLIGQALLGLGRLNEAAELLGMHGTSELPKMVMQAVDREEELNYARAQQLELEQQIEALKLQISHKTKQLVDADAAVWRLERLSAHEAMQLRVLHSEPGLTIVSARDFASESEVGITDRRSLR